MRKRVDGQALMEMIDGAAESDEWNDAGGEEDADIAEYLRTPSCFVRTNAWTRTYSLRGLVPTMF